MEEKREYKVKYDYQHVVPLYVYIFNIQNSIDRLDTYLQTVYLKKGLIQSMINALGHE